MQLVREGALELQLGHQPRVPVLSVEQYIKIREVRAPLERLATELAAVHATDTLLETLVGLNDAFIASEQSGRWKEAMNANQQFHFTIYRSSGNEVLVRTIENLWLLTGPIINNQYPAIQHGHRDTYPHLLIIDALRRRVPNEAGDLVVQDMRQGSALIVRFLQSAEGTKRRPRPRRTPTDPAAS
jgi:DNA-binding GntR family transcriptional regulator